MRPVRPARAAVTLLVVVVVAWVAAAALTEWSFGDSESDRQREAGRRDLSGVVDRLRSDPAGQVALPEGVSARYPGLAAGQDRVTGWLARPVPDGCWAARVSVDRSWLRDGDPAGFVVDDPELFSSCPR